MKMRIFSLLLMTLLLDACASAPRAASPSSSSLAPGFDSAAAASNSSLEIQSLLGHKIRTFAAQASASAVVARSLVDRDLLRQGTIHRDGYMDLLKHAHEFIQAQLRAPASNIASCRSPYSITLRIGERVQSARGCRTDPTASSFGKLARDGEFLLHRAVR
jgi:hypothetical protein